MAEACEVAAWLKALPCAPEFRPSEAEFADPIAYISKIEAEARTYGICKIVPPYPRASKKTVMANLNRSLLLQSPHSSSPAAPLSELELCRSMGGCMPPQVRRRSMTGCYPLSQPRTRSMLLPFSNDADDLKAKFNTRLQQLGCSSGKRSKVLMQTLAQKLVWQSGESYTLEQFEAKAKQFARARLKTSKDLPPFVIESLFWKAAADRTMTVEYGNDIPGSAFGEPSHHANMTLATPTKRKRGLEEESPMQHPLKEPKLEVKKEYSGPHQRADDSSSEYRNLEVAASSGTSLTGKHSHPSAKERSRKSGPAEGEGRAGVKLANSSWNMKVMARSPGSLLRYMPDEVPGVTSPMVYIGMLFSWFAWHVEDHELHSLNYLHTGAPKTWYAVPGEAAPALEEVVRVYGYGNISDPQAAFALLGEKTTVMSPEVLLAAGVPCCRLVQNAGEFVITFPRAYHLGFSHGFNCGEAANFASPAWLEVANEAATRRAAMDYLPMLSHQQLLYLLALSFCPRMPVALPFESSTTGQKASSGEDAVKTVFTNDVAHNNRLLALLVDSGVTGCVLVGDGADLTSALSGNKLCCSGVDNDSTTSNHMSNTLLETVACEKEAIKDDNPKVQDFLNSFKETEDSPIITNSLFRWGTLPCAACGILCFPSMAVVQPASKIENSLYPTKDFHVSASGHLSCIPMEEQDHAASSGHLLSKTDEYLQPLRTPPSEAGPVTSFAYIKDKKSLQWKTQRDTIEALHKEFQDDQILGGSSQGIQADQKHNVCKENENSRATGEVLDHLHGEIRKANGLQEAQECIHGSFNCEDELCHESAPVRVSTGQESSEIIPVALGDEVHYRIISGAVERPQCSNADLLADITKDSPIYAEIGNTESCCSGSLFQGCEDSSILDNLPLLDEVGGAMEKNIGKDAATSVLELLAVTYQDDSEDSGLADGNTKLAVVEAEHVGICFHPHSALVSDDEVGCTVDAPWHCVKNEVECALSLKYSDKLLTNNSKVSTPLSELDRFMCKEVLVQSDDGTYVNTGQSPEGVSISLEVGSVSRVLDAEESPLCLQSGPSCLDMPCLSPGKRASFAGSVKEAEQVESQAHKKPIVSTVDWDCQSKETDFSVPTVETSGSPHDSCNPRAEDAMNQISYLQTIRHPEKLMTESHLVGLPRNEVGEVVAAEINTAETRIGVISVFSENMASSSVEKSFPLDSDKFRLHTEHVPTTEFLTNCSTDVNGKQRDYSKFFSSEDTPALKMENDKLAGGQHNRLKKEAEDLCASNAEIVKTRQSCGDLHCNKSANNHLEALSSNALPRPRLLCLEHALEARHQLKLLGDSYMVLICHSDIGKIEARAKLFAEELDLRHSWRLIPLKEASQDEKDLINKALNTEEEGEDYSQDWVVQLGMSVRHCGGKTVANHSDGLYKKQGMVRSCEEKAESLRISDDDKDGKSSVAGHWCGKVWMKNEVHPVLGGCYTAQKPLQVCYPSVEDNAEDEQASTPEQKWNGDIKDMVGTDEAARHTMNDVDTASDPHCYSVPQRTNKKRKSNDETTVELKAESDFEVNEHSKYKRRELDGDIAALGSSCLASAVRKTSLSLTEITDLDTQAAGKKSCSLESNMCAKHQITDTKVGGDNHASDVAVIDHGGSDVDIWQDLDVGCYTQEVLLLDNIPGVTDTLMVDTCHQIDAESQENLLLPGMIRRRSCSVFDGEAQSQSLSRERDCAVSAFAECTMGEALHAVFEPNIPEGLDYTMGLKRKQDNQTDLTKKRTKARNFNHLDISNLNTDDFSHSTSESEQDIPFFEPSRNFNVGLICGDSGQVECVRADIIPHSEVHIPCCNTNQDQCRDAEQFSSLHPFETTTHIKNFGRMNSDSSSGSTQWRLLTQNSLPLVKCNSKKLAGKNGRKLRKQVNWENSHKDPPSRSLHVTESSDEDIAPKRALPRGRKKTIVEDFPFDCADFFSEGPSTRLRSRRVAKALSVDDDDDDALNGRHDDDAVVMGSRKKHKQLRQRAKKPMLKDMEDECGAYICELDGCSMSFSSKQELNLHKRNMCTFVGCNKRFGSHKYLLQHRRVHLDDRPLKCPWIGCKMTFKWKWACTEHYRVHTGERPYVCPIPECGRTFRFVSDFSRHKRKTGHTK